MGQARVVRRGNLHAIGPSSRGAKRVRTRRAYPKGEDEGCTRIPRLGKAKQHSRESQARGRGLAERFRERCKGGGREPGFGEGCAGCGEAMAVRAERGGIDGGRRVFL